VADTTALPVGPQRVSEKPAFVVPPSDPMPPTAPPATPPAAPPEPAPARAADTPGGAVLLRGKRCVLDYAVDAAGQQANGRVDVWATRDAGKSWQHLAQDGDRCSPAEFDLPGEGVFGVAVVVGRVGTQPVPPAAGDTPDCVVEVDTTAPVLIVRAERGTGADASAVTISWSATDPNLAERPAVLLWSAGTEGPWQPAARDLPAAGEQRWEIPAGVTGPVRLRVEATDRAGNVGRGDAPPITVGPTPRPRVRVLGVGGKPG
jgi:hypothetical protein